MARKIKRGFFTKRLYCSECNKRVAEGDAVCRFCGSEFILARRQEEPGSEETPESDEIEGVSGQGIAGVESPMSESPESLDRGLSLSRFKTVLWLLVAGMLLWGLFSDDSMLVVAAVLVLVVIELEAIRRKLA